MAGSVIQATGTVEFEDGLRTGVLPGGAPILGSVSNPTGVAGWSWVGCGCHSNSAEFRAWVVLNYSSYVVLR